MAIGLAGSAIGYVFWLPYVGGFNIKLILILALLCAASMAGAIMAISLLSQSIVGRKIEPMVFFRLIAYCSAVGVVMVVPVVGPFLTLWLLASTTVALKEVTSQDIGKSVILVIIGAVGGGVAYKIFERIIYTVMTSTGGY